MVDRERSPEQQNHSGVKHKRHCGRGLKIVIWLAAIVSFMALLVVLAGPPLLNLYVRPKVMDLLARAGDKFELLITAENVEASWRGQLLLEGVTVARPPEDSLFTAKEIAISLDPWDVLKGRTVPSHLKIYEMRVDVDSNDIAHINSKRGARVATVMEADDGGGDRFSDFPLIEFIKGHIAFTPVEGVPLEIERFNGSIDKSDDDGLAIEATGSLAIAGGEKSDWQATSSLDSDGLIKLSIVAKKPLSISGLPKALSDLNGLVSKIHVEFDSKERLATATLQEVQATGVDSVIEEIKPDLPLKISRVGASEVRALVALQDIASPAVKNLHVTGGFAGVSIPKLGDLDLDFNSVSIEASHVEDGIAVQVHGDAKALTEEATSFSVKTTLVDFKTIPDIALSARGPLPVIIASRLHNRILPWDGASVDVNASIHPQEGGAWQVSTDVFARGLTYFWTKIALVPLTNLGFSGQFNALINPSAGTVNVDVTRLMVADALFSGELSLKGLGDKLAIDAKVQMPKQPCNSVAEAIPPVMIPRLEGAVFSGDMSLSLEAGVDTAKIGPKGYPKAHLKVDADLESCKAESLGPKIRLKALERRYVHVVREYDMDKPLFLGPGTQSYVPIKEIPHFVQQAALATEDMGFFRHKGFQPNLVKRAMSMNIQRGWFVYGGSTITQQLVKNLYLSREKTLGRKLEEAIIVWQMEQSLEKEKILELYLNCIEFGEHVYGIRAAAKAYFNKEVRELTPLEGAFIMATKPKPRYGWSIYKKGEFNQWWVNRMEGILKRMWQEMDVIDERTFYLAAPYLPLFWYPETGEYKRPYTAPSVVVPQGMPADLAPVDDDG